MNSSGYTKEETARLGRDIYERNIRSKVEHEHDGRFLVVDVTTGRYAISDDELSAFDSARTENPDGAFFLLRVGRRAAHRLGGRLSCTTG